MAEHAQRVNELLRKSQEIAGKITAKTTELGNKMAEESHLQTELKQKLSDQKNIEKELSHLKEELIKITSELEHEQEEMRKENVKKAA